jgi:hypothetical protein
MTNGLLVSLDVMSKLESRRGLLIYDLIGGLWSTRHLGELLICLAEVLGSSGLVRFAKDKPLQKR